MFDDARRKLFKRHPYARGYRGNLLNLLTEIQQTDEEARRILTVGSLRMILDPNEEIWDKAAHEASETDAADAN